MDCFKEFSNILDYIVQTWCFWVIFLLFLFLAIKIIFRKRYWPAEIKRVTLGIAGNSIQLNLNLDDIQIAYKIWAELSTRKIGVKIDLENDTIEEIYNSWYQFFGITRELIKDIPVSKLNRQATREIAQISIDVLNQAMRPHLTQWQARFRKWYKQEVREEKTACLSPQDIQKSFPKYKELTEDLIKINKNLILYSEKMKELAFLNPAKNTNEK